MNSLGIPVSRDWLQLREAADATARAAELVEHVRRQWAPTGLGVVHDLGCGSGSMARWLAPRLPGPQHWVLHDWDGELLANAETDVRVTATDGAPVTLETRQRDITRLVRDELAEASLVTASAVLDLLTAEELGRLVRACVAAACPVLLTLTVVGRVDVVPVDPLDGCFGDAFNAHQRRTAGGGRRLLGPDAPAAAADAFARLGAEVEVRRSPWRLGRYDAALAVEWLSGWVAAACEQRPDLLAEAPAYLRRRRAEAASGRLVLTVHHQDLLARPR
jgi:trans-aconitate methyltransferase